MRLSRSPGYLSEKNDVAKPPVSPVAVVPPAPVLKAMGVVSGMVVDEKTGQPLAKVRVRIGSPSMDMRGARGGQHAGVFETQSDDNGRFKVEVPQQSRISIDAWLPGYESAAGSLMSGSSMDVEDLPFDSGRLLDVRLALRAALYVAGATLDEAGRALEGVSVTATVQDSEMVAYVGTTVSDANGRFELFDFPGVHDSTLQGVLTFEKGERLKTTLTNVYALASNQARALAVVLPRGQDVRGTVILSSGRPASKIAVTAIPDIDSEMAKDAMTDGEGRFVIRGLPKGKLRVRAHSFIHEQKGQMSLDFKGGEELTLKLSPVVLKQPLKLTSVLGMRLAALTPDLCMVYDLKEDTEGVLVVEVGPEVSRLQLPGLAEGCYFWLVGSRPVRDVRGWVVETLRVNELDPRAPAFDSNVGARGAVNIVYSFSRGGSYTTHMKLSDTDVAALRQVAADLERESPTGVSK